MDEFSPQKEIAMSWVPQPQDISQLFRVYLLPHLPFGIASFVVFLMMLFSVIFRVRNHPEKVVESPDIQEGLEAIKNKPEEVKMLWEYALHADDVFNDRQNFFLVFESILLGGSSALIGPVIQSHGGILAWLFGCVVSMGLLTTIAWWYTQTRQEYVLDSLGGVLKSAIDVYGKVISRVRERPYRVGSTPLLVHVLPILVASLWTAMLFFV